MAARNTKVCGEIWHFGGTNGGARFVYQPTGVGDFYRWRFMSAPSVGDGTDGSAFYLASIDRGWCYAGAQKDAITPSATTGFNQRYGFGTVDAIGTNSIVYSTGGAGDWKEFTIPAGTGRKVRVIHPALSSGDRQLRLRFYASGHASAAEGTAITAIPFSDATSASGMNGATNDQIIYDANAANSPADPMRSYYNVMVHAWVNVPDTATHVLIANAGASSVYLTGVEFITSTTPVPAFRSYDIEAVQASGTNTIVTVTGHEFAVGDSVVFDRISSMADLNTQVAEITAKDANTFTVAIDSRGYDAFTTGGIVSASTRNTVFDEDKAFPVIGCGKGWYQKSGADNLSVSSTEMAVFWNTTATYVSTNYAGGMSHRSWTSATMTWESSDADNALSAWSITRGQRTPPSDIIRINTSATVVLKPGSATVMGTGVMSWLISPEGGLNDTRITIGPAVSVYVYFIFGVMAQLVKLDFTQCQFGGDDTVRPITTANIYAPFKTDTIKAWGGSSRTYVEACTPNLDTDFNYLVDVFYPGSSFVPRITTGGTDMKMRINSFASEDSAVYLGGAAKTEGDVIGARQMIRLKDESLVGYSRRR